MEVTTWITSRKRMESTSRGLFGVTAALGVTGLVFMGFGQQCQPAEATGLNNRRSSSAGWESAMRSLSC